MVKQFSEHRQKTELYIKIMNQAIELGDDHLACIVSNKLKRQNNQEYSIATPTGSVIIHFPKSKTPHPEEPEPISPWPHQAVGLSIFSFSLLAMTGFAIFFL